MKVAMLKAVVFLAFLSISTATKAVVKNDDKTITKVVKLLQSMLDKSKAEGDEERTIYAKFKCYCDQSEAEKKASIKQLTEQIDMLESRIAEIQGDSGVLSSECAQLKVDMAANEAARKEATAIRDKEHEAFVATEADLVEAISDLKEAIEVLAEVGADQTKSVGADHKQFMAGYGEKEGFLQKNKKLQTVLHAVSALMNAKQRKTASAFLQAPFTGTYTSQSAEIMGILKEMRDTFTKDLAAARKAEADQLEAYDKFMAVKKEAFDKMEASYGEKQKYLADNDGELASSKSQLAEAENQKASDEEFLAKLIPMCEEKTKEYEKRKLLRANEEAAIAQAISILNSDAAFSTFGTVDATSTGSTGGPPLKFIQLRSVRKHVNGAAQKRDAVKRVLQKAAQDAHSSRLSKVVSVLQAENAFETVLEEIDKMLALIAEEAKQDKTNLDWCNKERDENEASLSEKEQEILKLEDSIDKLDTTINDPKTGLKKQIEETELALVQNKESQTTETASRTKDNLAYQADIKNLVDAETILEKAIKVLAKYYDDLAKKLAAGEALMQREDPTPTETWESNSYEGQSSEGQDVIKMLEFILSETKKEEDDAHSAEESAQADYEDSMTQLKKEEAEGEKNLVSLKETLAEKEKELLDAKEDLKKTTEDKEAIEAYLLKIKPGCDFITFNFELREEDRKIETEALEKAIKLIKGTPAYKAAVSEATVESYGDCKEPCVADAEDVKCKACMADVTIPGYCAGHSGTKGC
jgi:hypothetical protein